MLESPQSQGTNVGAWTTRLEHCPDCRRDMVQPTGYEPLWGDRWLIARNCPNCGWEHEGVVYAFCSIGCRTRFMKDPPAFLAAPGTHSIEAT